MLRTTMLMVGCALACCARGSGGPRPPEETQTSATPRQQDETAASAAPSDEPEWSPTVDGLRGRLVATSAMIPSSGQLEIALVLENVSVQPRRVQVSNPFALEATLHGSSGDVVQPTSRRVDVIMAPRWETLPPAGTTRSVVSIVTEDGGAPAHLDLTTSLWRLPAGSYRLSALYRSSEFAGPAPADAWSGTIALPRIDLAVR